MDTLQVPSTRNPIKIQPMDSGLITIVPDYDEEYGLGYQNTLVRIIIFKSSNSKRCFSSLFFFVNPYSEFVHIKEI